MVRIKDLMQYATRREVEAIASEMGYPKATEYPEAVLEEVQARCSKKQRLQIAVTEAPNTAHKDPEVIETNTTEYSEEGQACCNKKQRSYATVAEEASQQEIINISHEDLKDVDEGSQHRAAAMRVGGDALTLFYYATAQFTVPGLKEKVEESRNKLRQVLQGVAAAYEPEHFLAQTHLAQMAAGRNDSIRSLNGNSSLSDKSVPEEDGEPSGSS